MNRMIAAQLRKRPEPRMDLKCSVCWKIWKHLLKRKRQLSVLMPFSDVYIEPSLLAGRSRWGVANMHTQTENPSARS